MPKAQPIRADHLPAPRRVFRPRRWSRHWALKSQRCWRADGRPLFEEVVGRLAQGIGICPAGAAELWLRGWLEEVAEIGAVLRRHRLCHRLDTVIGAAALIPSTVQTDAGRSAAAEAGLLSAEVSTGELTAAVPAAANGVGRQSVLLQRLIRSS